MPLLNWNDELSVNVKVIDEQHKSWIDMLNRLHDAMTMGRGSEKVGETLSGLVAYTKIHFASEEKLMRINNYPRYEEHKRLHEDMVREVETLLIRYEAGEKALTFEVMEFLKNWLSEHIMTTDKVCGPYLNSKGIA